MPLISQTAEYALRAMGQIAVSEDDAFLRAKDLATRTEIPPHYLSKIMRRLVAAELVTSVKGHGGGFRIDLRLSRIRFVDIFDAVGFDLDASHCAFGKEKCNVKNQCLLHPVFAELNASFREWAKRTTLQDVVSGRSSLQFSYGPQTQPARR